MSTYQGMRWFKADFQVQTPEDNRHWADDDLRLLVPRRHGANGEFKELDIQEKAARFLRRCHELGLEIIGITDHNFSDKAEPRDWFLTHLVEQNKSVAREMQRAPLAIFPGFEVDIGYHVLCLFEPATKMLHIKRLNMILTKLGLAENERFRAGEPTLLRREGHTISLKTLLEVVQDKHGGIVIAAHADQNDGMLSSANHIADYQLPDLHAVEVTSYPLPERTRSILKGRNPAWSRRGRQPAYVQSSDAKSLKVGADGLPVANSLGYRSTWVKASKPSIAALRQAFLDGSSRLRLQDMCPSNEQTHPRIVFLKCQGLKFLADQEVVFSPNLNTLIGGRGTGKSTLLELLRFAFGRDQAGRFSASTRAKFQRVRATFSGDAEIQVGWESIPGQVDIISLRPDALHTLLQGEAPDVGVFLKQLPVQFYSQQQLSELTDIGGEGSLLGMIDDACAVDLQGLKWREETLRAEIVQVFAASDQLSALNEEAKSLTQELRELERQWQARKEVQEEALQYQRAELARQYHDHARAQIEADLQALNAIVERLSMRGVLNDAKADSWPRADWFNSFTQDAASVREKYAKDIAIMAADMRKETDALYNLGEGWAQVENELGAVKAGFLNACQERGLQPQDVARLQEIDRLRQAKQESLKDRTKRIDALKPQVARRDALLEELATLWAEQYVVRKRVAQEITQNVNGAIMIKLQPMADEAGFLKIWESMIPDGRGKLGRAWAYIGGVLFADFQQGIAVRLPALPSPWLHIRSVLMKERPTPLPLLEYMEDLRRHLAEQKDAWRLARLTRVEDQMDIELYRSDKTLVGSILSRALSEGQRNTAVLNFLLAKGDGPIIIDQPEDELDSNFIYKELVPLLRAVKNQRQLIVATHNANLPVNADSDLVYALDVKDGRGVRLAIGGLDHADTTDAVLNIMEGSAEAFKRRFEKYHF
ncbi:AAA family ATPase [Pseudomonas frederiksbergensis]|uniref:TrlF family AAA-like ATPase n=1 Tax=Pseudomonas frederiksbergensis TaxID=104087 RepID=UPI0019808540|nr:AAA family ATPase [Pseudomonas frederiksbergensis]MBN3863433.1 AAA family ATPase [Pseudomonas frederiksbergensis]